MFESFKQLGDLRRADKVERAIDIASAAFAAGQIHVAEHQLEAAYKLCLETTFIRMPLINLITFWGLIGIEFGEMGYSELADRCKKMSALLQARFDAGEYYRDP